MSKINLTPTIKKAILSIEDKVIDISNLLRDVNMKLSYLIKNKRSYYDMLEGNGFPDHESAQD